MIAPRTLATSTTVLLSVLLLAGCGSANTDTTAKPTAAPSGAASAAPQVTTDDTPAPAETTDEDLTCETMIPESVVGALTSQGWSATASQLSVGSQTIDDSLLCTWAPTGSFEGQMYGVGRLTSTEENQLRSDLAAQGWTTQDAADGVYFTAPVAAAPTPAPGATASTTGGGGTMSGFTYLLGDGWVKYADTRDGILLIVTPVS